jgi:DNA-binding MarR family transcriptional regulator
LTERDPSHGSVHPAAELMASIERVRRLSNRQSRLLQDRLGVTIYQVGLLAAVEDGAVSVGSVAHATGQPVSGASRLVERLVRDGLLARSADERDRRAVVLSLTSAGRATLERARSLIGETMQQALAGMPPPQAEQLLPTLASFLDAAEGVIEDSD